MKTSPIVAHSGSSTKCTSVDMFQNRMIRIIGVQGEWQFFPSATCYCPPLGGGVRPKFFATCLFLAKIFCYMFFWPKYFCCYIYFLLFVHFFSPHKIFFQQQVRANKINSNSGIFAPKAREIFLQVAQIRKINEFCISIFSGAASRRRRTKFLNFQHKVCTFHTIFDIKIVIFIESFGHYDK